MPDTGIRTSPTTSTDAVGRPGALRVSEADLRAFYDPAGHGDGRPVGDLLDQVAVTRTSAVLPGAGRLTRHEVILAEALHACLAIDDRAGVPLAVPPERQRRIAHAVDRHADSVARAVTALAGALTRGLSRGVAREPDLGRRAPRSRPRTLRRAPASERLVSAGRVLAAVAHDGVLRRNGRDYYSHPDEVAAILTAAWHHQPRPAPGPRLPIARFLAYCHDAFEDTLDPAGDYLGQPLLVTPRVALAVLTRHMVPDAAAIARVLLLMTRTRSAADNSRMPYLDHVERGIREGGSYFLLTKAGDIHHNLNIEPEDTDPHGDQRSSARRRKRELYRLAATRLYGAADQHDPATAWTVHNTFTIQPADLTPSPRTPAGHPRDVAATIRGHFTS